MHAFYSTKYGNPIEEAKQSDFFSGIIPATKFGCH